MCVCVCVCACVSVFGQAALDDATCPYLSRLWRSTTTVILKEAKRIWLNVTLPIPTERLSLSYLWRSQEFLTIPHTAPHSWVSKAAAWFWEAGRERVRDHGRNRRSKEEQHLGWNGLNCSRSVEYCVCVCVFLEYWVIEGPVNPWHPSLLW